MRNHYLCPQNKIQIRWQTRTLKKGLRSWRLEIGLPLTISELGATADMIPGITGGTICYPAGYIDLKPEDITEILNESL